MLKMQFLSIIIHVIFYTSTAFGDFIQHGSLNTASRSVKNTFQKENARFQDKLIKGMQDKISSLETSVEQAGDVMKTIQAQNKNLEASIKEQQFMLERMENEFTSIENLILMHGNLLKELKQTVYPDEQAFAISNETCGGVLHAQSGYAIYTSKNQQLYRGLSTFVAPTCVWTVQSNHRSLITLTTHLLDLPYSTSTSSEKGAFAIEGIGESGASFFQPTSVTKLMKKVTYSFKGPLLYIVLNFPENTQISALNTFNFQFQYESSGRRIQLDTLFLHKNVPVNLRQESKAFNEKDFDTSILTDSHNATTAFTSIIISNFTAQLHLRTVWEKEKCTNNTFIAVLPITAVLSHTNTSQITNLCANQEHLETNLLTSYGKPLMILVNRSVEQIFPITLSWAAETEYPSNLRQSVYPMSAFCGSVVGGSEGYISYKEGSTYRNGERCVFVIVPQPAPTSSIDISFFQRQTGSYNIKEANYYDHIYIMELTTIDGDERTDGPKITRLNAVTKTTYTAMSREVYVVFYSDSSVIGNGFYLQWKTSGETVKTGNDISTRYNFASSHNGTMNLVSGNSDFFNTLYQIFIFTPTLPSYSSNYIFGMNLELNQTVSEAEATDSSEEGTHNTCVQENFNVLAVDEDGILQKREIECYSPGKATIRNANGMVVIIAKSYPTVTGNRNRTFNFSWKQDFSQASQSVVEMSNNKCGGVIIGDRGFLKYKIEQLYNKNEHCLWLLQSPNGTSITLKLLKDGFGEKDRLIVNTINADNGTLRNDAVQLRSLSHKLYSVNDSFLVISFRPSPLNVNATGFFLQFWSNNSNSLDSQQDQGNVEYVNYRLRHSELHNGRFLYASENQSLPNAPEKQLHIVAFSSSSVANSAVKSITTNVRWSLGVFKKNNESCDYDTIVFYTTLLANESGQLVNNDGQLWKQNILLPEENDTLSCPSQVRVGNQSTVLFSTNYSAFLVIYKLIPNPVDEDSGGDGRKIDFTHSQSKIMSSVATETDDDVISFRNPFYRSYASSYRGYESILRRRLGQRLGHYHYGWRG